jgi:hypothetical protein
VRSSRKRAGAGREREGADPAIARLVASANEVAELLGRGVDPSVAPERVAGHLRRQWRSEMRERLKAHVASGRAGLSELAMRAVVRL